MDTDVIPAWEDEQDEEAKERAYWEKLQSATAGFVAKLSETAQQRISQRNYIEQRWLDDLRQYHGIYDDSTQAILDADPNRSKVFINITGPKTKAWAARLGDMLFPTDDKNWGIKPTPAPDIVQSAKVALKLADQSSGKALALTNQYNDMVDEGGVDPQQLAQTEAEVSALSQEAQRARQHDAEVRKITEQATRAAEAMETEIDDQLSESNYPAQCRDVIDDACKLGIGILKGPMSAAHGRRSWTKTEQGYSLTTNDKPAPMFRRVDPWHFFPDPDATSMEDNDSTFERHLYTKSKFRRLAKTLGFNEEAVETILRGQPQLMSGGDNDWLTQLRTMSDSIQQAQVSRYIVWEYHGQMERDDIAMVMTAMGDAEGAQEFIKNSSSLQELPVIVYFCQGRLLKISEYHPLDSGETLYSTFSFEKSEATILGAVGIPRLMRHEQSMLNSAIRMMLDNAQLGVGPQIVIDKTRVTPENGDWHLTGRKVWSKTGQDLAGDQRPFETFNITMNQSQLEAIILLSLRLIDDVVSLPTIAEGEQGAHVTQTMTGMSMLFNAANVVFRRVIKNWDDDLTAPTIRRAFDWNMQFNEKEQIKGDAKAIARGTSVLLVKEIQAQHLLMIAQNWTAHPIIGPALKVYETLRITLQTLNLDHTQVMKSPEEFEAALKAMAEAEGGQENPDVIRAKASIEVANITAKSHEMQAQSQASIAQMNQQTEIMKLIQKDGVDLAKIQSMLGMKKIDTDSKERMFAAEAAIEQRNAQEARARGEEPGGSGGYISAGGGVE